MSVSFFSPPILEGCLILAGAGGGAGVVGSWIGGWSRKILFPLSGVIFFLLTLCFLSLICAFLTDDFFFLLVAENSHTSMDLLYKLGATWGQPQGSLLLWTWCLGGYSFYVSAQRWSLLFYRGTIGTMLFFTTVFIGFEIGWFNPFELHIWGGKEGFMLNPLLQDGSLDLHPPLLFLGLVGTSILFAMALTWLKVGSSDLNVESIFLRFTMRWVWSLLTIGISLGSLWAFYELGWGGFWFWDPVENLALLPWIALTGALHTGRTEVSLVSLFFCLEAWGLALLSTLLIRSGLLRSVHGFAEGRGPGVLVAFLWVGGALMVGWIFSRNRQKFSLISSKTGRLFWLAIFCLQAILLIILFGTIYPLISQIFGVAVSVGTPYFNTVLKPFALLLLVGSGLSFATTSWQGNVVSIALSLSGSFLILPDFEFWNFFLLTAAFWVISQAFIHCFKAFLKEEKPQWIRWFGHLGLGIVAIGVILEGAWRREAVLWIQSGGADVVFSLPFHVRDISLDSQSLYHGLRVRLSTPYGELEPERRFWVLNGQTTSESSLQWLGPLSLLDVSIGEVQETGLIQLRFGFHRGVIFVWLGALLAALGVLLQVSQGWRRWRAPLVHKEG